jgi:hypothetical protein
MICSFCPLLGDRVRILPKTIAMEAGLLKYKLWHDLLAELMAMIFALLVVSNKPAIDGPVPNQIAKVQA